MQKMLLTQTIFFQFSFLEYILLDSYYPRVFFQLTVLMTD